MAKNAVALSDWELANMGKEALGRVGRTISAIEDALSAWNASKTKPPELKNKIIMLKKFHEQLKGWGRKFGIAEGERASFQRRIMLLREFVKICHAYETNVPAGNNA